MAKAKPKKKPLTLNEQVIALEKVRQDLFALRDPIDKKLTRSYDKLKKLKSERDKHIIETMEKSGRVDWKELLAPAGDFASMEMYYYFDKKIRELGMHASGRWRDTHEPGVQIMLTYGDPETLKKNIAGVRKLMKHYTPVKGEVRFGIFDHGLSEHATYTLFINIKTKEAELDTNSFGRHERKPLGKLPTAMKYLQEHHWYDGKETDGDYDY